jgi:regulator of CtrA degradation
VESNPKRRRTDKKEPISFGKAYAQSDTFRALFKEGMRLVEETADYLDGDGRAAARVLPRPASIVYATESMRLTTRLMQLDSWLLLHRSVREGDMTAERAREEKKKIRLENSRRA